MLLMITFFILIILVISSLTSADVSLAIRSFGTRAVVDASLPSVQDRDTDAKDRMTSQSRRNFTYFMVGGLRFMYASIIRFAVVRFVATMTMSAKVLALASIEVELDAIEEGKCSLITFRGKPLFVRHRTAEETADPDAGIDIAALKDPQSDLERCPRPEWVVCMGVCTHLGCVPTALAGDYNGWFCPCHGSHYDTCGRIRKGPAPLNLEIPDYSFVTDDLLKVG
eukprot:TRINITY_DN15925_c0_g1_i1.p1 TRINITY_DN15925_c0_g1~~TRINITY_DN15925_c0_g1_i1.p1  ORF type:complete len:225 (+),score=47.98 TRINITY_DN15925_c0_g1_i1:99-773(+)